VKPTASYPVGENCRTTFQRLSRSPGDARGIGLVSPGPSGQDAGVSNERGIQENFRTSWLLLKTSRMC